MMGRLRWKWVTLAALLAAALSGPASADDCAVLLDTTGTLLVITDRGTISQFFVHSLPVLSENFEKEGPQDDEGAAAAGYGEGFSVHGAIGDGRIKVLARAEGNSSHPTEGVVPEGDCAIRTLSGRPAVRVTPDGVNPPLYLVPPRSEVSVETWTRSANGLLRFWTWFRFVGGSSEVNTTVWIRNASKERVRMYGYKRFADVDLTGHPANAFQVTRTLECRASDPDIDPASGLGQNGFSREFIMSTKGSGSSPFVINDDQFSGGAYSNAIGNVLAEQRSLGPVFGLDCLLLHQPFCSLGATRRDIGFWDDGGESPYDYEDDRALFILHNFAPGWVEFSVPLILHFKYEVR